MADNASIADVPIRYASDSLRVRHERLRNGVFEADRVSGDLYAAVQALREVWFGPGQNRTLTRETREAIGYLVKQVGAETDLLRDTISSSFSNGG